MGGSLDQARRLLDTVGRRNAHANRDMREAVLRDLRCHSDVSSRAHEGTRASGDAVRARTWCCGTRR